MTGVLARGGRAEEETLLNPDDNLVVAPYNALLFDDVVEPFLYDGHRFNVATSRARALCILVGSPALFEPECRTPKQMKMANGVCRFLEMVLN